MRWFLPKTTDFAGLFERATSNLGQGVRLFRELLEHPGEYSPIVERIKQVEHEGDRLTHQTIERLNTTFITPFDREDIHTLISRLDDVMDAVDAAAQRLVLYRIVEIPRHVVRMADLLVLAADELAKALAALHDRRKQEAALDACVEVNRLENDADVLHREALAALFAEGVDAITVIKLKDLYAFLEEATDRCEDVANVVETILIKGS